MNDNYGDITPLSRFDQNRIINTEDIRRLLLHR